MTNVSQEQKIVVVGTGGTISSRYESSTRRSKASQAVEKVAPSLGQDLLDLDLEFQNFALINSFEMTAELAYKLVRHIQEQLSRPDIAGVVVTHGTDTMEESAFLADLLLTRGKPIVFTGAQLPQDDPRTDGPGNLEDAIRAATSPLTQGLGVLVCFIRQLHAARDVSKVHTGALETFQSPCLGPLGCVDGDQVVVFRRPARELHLTAENLHKKVDLIRLSLGMDARLIDFSRESGADGIVVEAFGRGNTTTDFGRGVKRACDVGIPVVITSRCLAGRVKPIYGSGGGGGRDLEDAGAIFAGDLKGPKARILLMVALSNPKTRTKVRELFQIIAS